MIMLVRHAMTPDPETFGPEETCYDALRVMQAKGFRHAPVVEDGRLVGVVSERDLLRALPHLIGEMEGEGGAAAMAVTVGAAMSRSPRTCSPTEPLDQVARELLDRRIGCMAVVNGERLVGILTTTDVLRGFTDHLVGPSGDAMTFVWNGAGERPVPDVAGLAAAAGVELVAFFRTETSTGALALMARVRGDEEARGRFVESCVSAGSLLMANRRAA